MVARFESNPTTIVAGINPVSVRRQPIEAAEQRLIYSRKQAGALLGGISISQLTRLENEGKLKSVRFGGSRGQAFYTHAELMRLIQEHADAS